METTIEPLDEQTAHVHVSGQLDATVAADLKQQLKALVQEDGKIFLVVDLADVWFIDSSGLSSLVSGLKAVREHNGMLVLLNVGEQVQVTLELTQLNRIFPVANNLDEALARFG